MDEAEKRVFYGSITVSARGQIVIPTEARQDFKINVGDKLLVFGHRDSGLWICTPEIMGRMFGASVGVFDGMKGPQSQKEALAKGSKADVRKKE